jgi:outer membrane lipoprotein carrier protein
MRNHTRAAAQHLPTARNVPVGSKRSHALIVLLALFAGSLALAVPAGAQAPGSAERILEAAAERYRSLDGFCADFRQVVDNRILGDTIRSHGEICQGGADRFEMRFSDPEGDRVVADGVDLWIYLPSADAGQVFRASHAEVGGRFDLHREFLNDPGERYAPRLEGEEVIDGRRTHILALSPVGPSPYLRARIWVDAADSLIRRVEIVEDEGFSRTLHLTEIRLNPDIPMSRFRFEVPPGVQVIRT